MFNKVWYFIIILITTGSLTCKCQDSSFIKKNAIEIGNAYSLGPSIYQAILKYKLIMLGEMHGTREVVTLIRRLTRLLTENGDTVQVGFEIPPEWLKEFIDVPTRDNLYKTIFFGKGSAGERSNLDWAEAILGLSEDLKTKLFYFDGCGLECNLFIRNINGESYYNRDSLMYLKIKEQILKHPKWKTLTISGNIHNRLLPFNNFSTMGVYLANDESLKANEICILSISHWYKSGTQLSDWGDGIKEHQYENPESTLTKSTNYENFFLIYPNNLHLPYNAVYFTTKINASKLTYKSKE